jgi:hypothetical protein
MWAPAWTVRQPAWSCKLTNTINALAFDVYTESEHVIIVNVFYG